MERFDLCCSGEAMHERVLPADCALVTAVIPTRGRPELLTAAIRSALRQTWTRLEIVVVIDGPDAATEQCVRGFAGRGVRTILLPERRGGSAARNAGARAA